MHPTALRSAAAAAALLLLAGCAGAADDSAGSAAPSSSQPAVAPTQQPSPTEAAPTSSAPTAEARSGFVTYADYSGDPAAFAAGPVVLFFHADWCPKCRETKENLTADPASLPEGMTVVEVDFDSETDLRQKYGVTVQHTFVQVDADGQKVSAWTGTFTGQDIASKVA
jgi:thiol-disulfide isomerase/thioredoxin